MLDATDASIGGDKTNAIGVNDKCIFLDFDINTHFPVTTINSQRISLFSSHQNVDLIFFFYFSFFFFFFHVYEMRNGVVYGLV